MIKLHFLNVGHGDCIVVEFIDNKKMAVIDINMTEEMDANSYAELLEESLNSLNAVERVFHELTGYSNEQLLECYQKLNLHSFRQIIVHRKWQIRLHNFNQS